MRNKLAITATLLVLSFSSSLDAAPLPQRKKTLFEKVGKAIRTLVEPRRQQKIMAVPVAPRRAPNAKAEEKRLTRVQANANAFGDWISRTCDLDETQRGKLEEVLKSEIKNAQGSWRAGRLAGMGQNGNWDFAPFEFVSAARPMQTQIANEVRSHLSDDQKKTLKDALTNRDKQVRRGLASLAVLMLDAELYLTEEQREQAIKLVDPMLGSKIYNGLFGFQNNGFPFQRLLLKRNAELLTLVGDSRARRLQRLSQNGNGDQYATTTIQNGDATTGFEAAIRKQPARLAEAMAVRIEWLAEEEGFSKAHQRRLTLAAKGAASRAIAEWAERTRKQVKQMEERFPDRNVSWSFSTPRVSEVDRQAIWKKTLERVRESTTKGNDTPVKDAESAREKSMRGAMVSYILATLEQEVWLRPEQRGKLRSLIDGSLGDFRYYAPGGGSSYTELQMLADALHLIPDSNLGSLLSKTQSVAWNTLKDMLKREPDGHMIKFTHRHGDISFPFVGGRRTSSNRRSGVTLEKRR